MRDRARRPSLPPRGAAQKVVCRAPVGAMFLVVRVSSVWTPSPAGQYAVCSGAIGLSPDNLLDDECSLSVGFQEQAPVLLNQDALHDRARNVSSGVPRGE